MTRGIIVAGALNADLHYEMDTYPAQGMLVKVRSTAAAVGGTGNLMLDLAKMDPEIPIQASAIVGRDESGKMILDTLQAYPNIDTSPIILGERSAVTLVMNAMDSHQRTFFFLPEACDEYDESCIQWDQLNGDIFHLEYLLSMKKVDAPDETYGTHGAKILHDAKQRGMMTSIDIVSEQSDRAARVVRAALKYTDICAINEVEAQAVTGVPVVQDGQVNAEKAWDALREMKALGVAKWAVIHSPMCSYGYDCSRERMYFVPSLKLPDGFIKGTTGAGDAYCSGILYGAYMDDTLENAMHYATACAACSLSENNGTDGMRPREQILALEKELQKKRQ